MRLEMIVFQRIRIERKYSSWIRTRTKSGVGAGRMKLAAAYPRAPAQPAARSSSSSLCRSARS